jgi:hypothetical protein
VDPFPGGKRLEKYRAGKLIKEEEMHRKTVHRGIAALALVTVLALGGAQPAAAANLSFLDRVASLWTAVTEREPATSLWDTVAGWFSTSTQKESDTTPITDRGAGLDPNGTCLTATPTDPTFSSGR